MKTYTITLTTDHPDALAICEDATHKIAEMVDFEGTFSAELRAQHETRTFVAFEIHPQEVDHSQAPERSPGDWGPLDGPHRPTPREEA